MRWLLCHKACWNFVQWICFTGSRVICMSLYLWNLPCNITSFWLFGYLTAVQVRKRDTTIDWEEFKDYSSDCSHAKNFQFPWQTCCLLKKAMQQQRNPHLVQIRVCCVCGTEPGTREPGPSTAVIYTHLQEHPLRIFPIMWCNTRYQPALEVFLLKQQ